MPKEYSNEYTVSGQKFNYIEKRRGDNRDIQIVHCIEGAEWVQYTSNDGPHQQDSNWYDGHVSNFYDSLAAAIANAYIANGNVWVNSVNVRIHRTDYQYNLS